MTSPTVLILHAPGTNRDGDAARAVELAGGRPLVRTLTALRDDPSEFRRADALILPGGFSYGDALGAGRRWALDLEIFFHDELRAVVDSGRRVLGICNGFQVLVKAGLLPGGSDDEPRRATLTHNASGHFECRWVHLAVEPNCRATWLHSIEGLIASPVAHGEGNLQLADEAEAERLAAEGLVAMRYVDDEGNPAEGRFPINPNGSVADIAALCNGAGNVVGLMPHPEDHLLPIQNPWGRSDRLGLALFEALLRP